MADTVSLAAAARVISWPLRWVWYSIEPPVLPGRAYVTGGQDRFAQVEISTFRPLKSATVSVDQVEAFQPASNDAAMVQVIEDIDKAWKGVRTKRALPFNFVLAAQNSVDGSLLLSTDGGEGLTRVTLPEGDWYLKVTVLAKSTGRPVRRSYRLRLNTGSVDRHQGSAIDIDTEGQKARLSTLYPGTWSCLALSVAIAIAVASALYAPTRSISLTRFGLVLDFAGVSFLAVSALGKEVLRVAGTVLGGGYPLSDASPVQREKDREAIRGRIGISLALLGFLLQFAAQYAIKMP